MQWTRRRLRSIGQVLLIVCAITVAIPQHPLWAGERTTEERGWYNSDYIFAATRGVNDMDAHPAVKITLVPVTIVLDVAFLPFAVVMGFFGP